MRVTQANNVKVYTVSGDSERPLPEWLIRQKKRQLRNDAEFQNRVELLQDFEFPEASNRVKVTRDGNYAVATGVYKPQMRVYDFAEMSMKFERHTSAENVQFVLLSDDWTKSVHLQNDRSIEFHNQGGIQYQTRIPKFGRDLAYHYPSCDLYIAAAGDEVYRLNLEQGKFLNSLEAETEGAGVNCMDISPAHQLIGLGTEAGTVEFWDPRYRSRVGILTVNSPQYDDSRVTAVSFRDDGLNFGVGTKAGQTLLYDLRSPLPYLSKDQGYGLPIKKISWLDSPDRMGNSLVLSADNKIIKLWSATNGDPFVSMEPPLDVNDVCPVPNTGLIFVANEGTPMHTYYIPQLGPAPRWCAFLDNLTDEMEENSTQITYDNYKFVTRKELASLGLNKLIGTNVVRSYMHGYFIDVRLWEQARLISNPFAYEEYRERRLLEKIEKERESRIRTNSQQFKVNKNLAARLQERKRIADAKARKGAEAIDLAQVLEDSRFKDAFENPEFEIDENTVEFSQLNPATSTRQEKVDSDEEDASSDESVEEEYADEIKEVKVLKPKETKMKEKSVPVHKAQPLKMSVVSSAKPSLSALGQETSFETLLEREKARGLSEMSWARDRPSGEMHTTWKEDGKKEKDKADGPRQKGDHSNRAKARRSASKNVFRRM